MLYTQVVGLFNFDFSLVGFSPIISSRFVVRVGGFGPSTRYAKQETDGRIVEIVVACRFLLIAAAAKMSLVLIECITRDL